MSCYIQTKSHNQKVKSVFSKTVASRWETKGQLIDKQSGNDNIVYSTIEQFGHNGMELLDVGCATGRLISHVASRFEKCKIHGIDISEEMTMYAKEVKSMNGNQIEIFTADFCEFDFNGKRYDMIILKFVLHHMENEKWVLIKAKSLLKPGGIIIIYTPGKRHFKETFVVEGRNDYLGRKNIGEIKELLFECGMESVDIKSCDFKLQMRSFHDFIEFLKCIGSYQKIMGYSDMQWRSDYEDEVRSRYMQTDWHTGEYILAVYKSTV